jgi:hypothetical protein
LYACKRFVYSSNVPAERFESELETEQPGSPSKRVAVVVDERGLVVDEKIACARGEFFGGGLENLTTHFRVLLVAKSEDPKSQAFWFFRLPDREAAQAMLRAAGLDAASSALQLRSGGGGWTSEGVILPAAAALVVALGFLLRSTTVGVCLLIAACGVLFAANAVRPLLTRIDLRIGTDGIFRTHLLQSQFFAFTRIRNVWGIGSRVSIQLVDGSIVDLKYDGPSAADAPSQMSFDRALAQLIKMRVLDGVERGIAAIEILRQDFEVARGAREVREWLAELRKLRVPLADYRTAPQPEVDLDALFADGSLDAQTRLGAAFALRARYGDKAAPRLRIAAATTASPELKSAFENIAEGSFEDDFAERIVKIR